MKLTSTLKIAASAAVLFAGMAAFAKNDVRPGEAVIKVSAKNLPSSNASEKSQGLPNASGEKLGNGYRHFKSNGLGHGNGNGHGHDSDPETP